MPSKNTIRSVYLWASTAAPKTFTPRDAAGFVPLSYRAIGAALEALEDMGIVEDTTDGWVVKATLLQFEAAMEKLTSDTLEAATSLEPIERVRDVFEYAQRCAALET